MCPSGYTWVILSQTGSFWGQVGPIVMKIGLCQFKGVRRGPNWSKLFKRFQIGPNGSKMSYTGPNQSKQVQKGCNKHQHFQTGPKKSKAQTKVSKLVLKSHE